MIFLNSIILMTRLDNLGTVSGFKKHYVSVNDNRISNGLTEQEQNDLKSNIRFLSMHV